MYLQFAKRVDLKGSHTHTHTHTHTQKITKITMWGDGYVDKLDCGNHFTMHTYVKTSHYKCKYNFYLSIIPQ